MRAIRITFVVLALSAMVFAQQDKSKRPSPPGTAQVTLNGKNISVDYSRPSMKGRKIFGSGDGFLVPYGQVWRAGANEATTLKTDADVDIGGTNVPAGTYTLFVLPDQDKWTLIISKKTGEWGIPYPGQQDDFARVPMNVTQSSQTVDQFTISLDKRGNNQADLSMAWANTKASVPIQVK